MGRMGRIRRIRRRAMASKLFLLSFLEHLFNLKVQFLSFFLSSWLDHPAWPAARSLPCFPATVNVNGLEEGT